MNPRSWLTRGGALAAVGVGTVCLAGVGLRGLAMLFAFLVSSSLLSREGPRQAGQVLANGAIAALGAALALFAPRAGAAVFAGALAAATADTWATEIGAFSPTLPRDILTWASVPHGTSGGITLLGTAGGLLGAAGMGALAAVLFAPALPLLGVALAGAAGMVADSVCGAALQGQDGRGVPWITNDVVNWAGTATGGAVAVGYCCWPW